MTSGDLDGISGLVQPEFCEVMDISVHGPVVSVALHAVVESDSMG